MGNVRCAEGKHIQGKPVPWFNKFVTFLKSLTKNDLPNLHTLLLTVKPREYRGYPQRIWLLGIGKDSKLSWLTPISTHNKKRLENLVKINFPDISIDEEGKNDDEVDLSCCVSCEAFGLYETNLEDLGEIISIELT